MKKVITYSALIFLFACTSPVKRMKIFPVYGNYCRPAHIKIISKLDPVSVTDFLCEERLDCYERNGRKRYESCDGLFVSELIKITPKSAEESAVRQSIISYFKK